MRQQMDKNLSLIKLTTSEVTSHNAEISSMLHKHNLDQLVLEKECAKLR